ncbi:hypothetical protein ABFS83_08G233900 [Erythranthe nasuta]
MSWIWTTTISVIIFLYLLQQWLNLSKKKKKLPPGPLGFPIIGHFHLLGKNPHHDLTRLAQKHGPIMHLRFGSVDTIVVSSPDSAELFLKTHDLVFASRPHHEASTYLGYDQKTIVFGPYGPYWRNMRKLCTSELLCNPKIGQFRPMRKMELGLLVDSLKRAGPARETVDMSERITSLAADFTCMMMFGRKYSDRDLGEKGFRKVMEETMKEAAAFNIGDYFPYLRGLDLQGSARRLKDLSKIFDGFLERVIDDHVRNKEERKETMDFVDTLLSIMESGEAGFEFDRRHVKAVLLDLLVAGLDTSATAMEWTLSEVINHPSVTKKLQIEIAETVGKNQLVDESHLPHLKYLDYVVRESLRLHPVGPLLIHESMEDCEVNGLHIPKKARVLVNVWAIGRDPNVWADPERFWPDRFVESPNVDLRGRDFQLIPFGSGRRGCPGMQLALTIVQLVVAQLVHCFDWEIPGGGDVDMTEEFGLVTGRAKHLMVRPTYRLNK